MSSLDRFQLEQQLLDSLDDKLTVTWLLLSNRLKRSLLLAGGFMDVSTIRENVKEIHGYLSR